jgi:hypothetical protein
MEEMVFAPCINVSSAQRIADPGRSHNSSNSQPVADWTPDKMQACRKAAAKKK